MGVTDRPVLPRGVRLHDDRVRGTKVLLGPETALMLDEIGAAIIAIGILAFLIGIAAEIPFMDLPFFVGPVATALGGVDIAFVVGLAVSGLAYVLFSRGQDRSREISLMAAHPEVTDPRDTGEIRAELSVEEKEQH